MKQKLYSYLLVTSQFICVITLGLCNASFLEHPSALLIFGIGFGFGVYTLRYNRLSNFNIRPDIKENAILITSGPYRYIRHPMYFSVLIVMAGVLSVSITLLTFSLYILLIVTLFLKARKEEQLWCKHSSLYQDYKNHTKCMIPFLL